MQREDPKKITWVDDLNVGDGGAIHPKATNNVLSRLGRQNLNRSLWDNPHVVTASRKPADGDSEDEYSKARKAGE